MAARRGLDARRRSPSCRHSCSSEAGRGRGTCLRDQALALCSRIGASEAGYRATSLSTLVQMLVGTSGVTLLPALAVPVENRTAQLAIRPFTNPAPARTLGLAWRRGSALKTTLEAVAATIKDRYARRNNEART